MNVPYPVIYRHPYNIYHITRARKNYANYTQTLHSILHSADLPSVTKCMVCAANYTQTIHKTIHRALQKTPQRACTETLHRTLHGNPLASKTIQPGRLDSLACLILPLRNHTCRCSPGTVQPSRLSSSLRLLVSSTL